MKGGKLGDLDGREHGSGDHREQCTRVERNSTEKHEGHRVGSALTQTSAIGGP